MNKFLVFTAGAIFGSLVTWKLTKDKYARIAQEEIDSVKEVFARREREEIASNEQSDNEEDEEGTKPSKEEIDNYKKIIAERGYTTIKEDEAVGTRPYVIPPEDFGDDPDYKTVSLTYYADKVLTDEDNHVINPGRIDDLIGEDSLTHFGEYEEDSVFVRNEKRKTDYEILLDMSKYLGGGDEACPSRTRSERRSSNG